MNFPLTLILFAGEGKYEIIDNFNQVSFTATIPEDDKRYLNVQNLEPTTLFHIVQSTDEVRLKSFKLL